MTRESPCILSQTARIEDGTPRRSIPRRDAGSRNTFQCSSICRKDIHDQRRSLHIFLCLADCRCFVAKHSHGIRATPFASNRFWKYQRSPWSPRTTSLGTNPLIILPFNCPTLGRDGGLTGGSTRSDSPLPWNILLTRS